MNFRTVLIKILVLSLIPVKRYEEVVRHWKWAFMGWYYSKPRNIDTNLEGINWGGGK